MNPYACADISRMQLFSVQTVTAVKELIVRQYELPCSSTDSPVVDHSIAASPITADLGLRFGCQG
jgi:hypothetical protein